MPCTVSTLATLCQRHAPHVGGFETPLNGVALYRRDAPFAKQHTLYRRSLFIVAQGAKRVYVGDRSDEVLAYDEERYLVTAVPMPVQSHVLTAANDRPFLSIGIDLDLELIREVITRGAPIFHAMPPAQPQRGLAVSHMSDAMREATCRLLALLDTPEDIPALAALRLQELVYHVLRGPQGGFLRALAMGHGQQHTIGEILTAIHGDCTRDHTISDLAMMAGMSETVFFEAFKLVTGTSPLQYIKRLRLMEAHRRITLGITSVSEVAYGVGYNSASQFSREFKRAFGAPPSALLGAAS